MGLSSKSRITFIVGNEKAIRTKSIRFALKAFCQSEMPFSFYLCFNNKVAKEVKRLGNKKEAVKIRLWCRAAGFF
jgi:hypothetical protein